MGEFARGIHIYKKDKADAIQAISAALQAKKFAPCDGKDFDRAVAVIKSGDWISIFDSDVYDDSFNKALSLKIDAHCVSFDLMDGDSLQAILWKNGRRLNTYISDPLRNR